jgi:predicted ribosomally synthesized peptide with SipW-like signal peptide
MKKRKTIIAALVLALLLLIGGAIAYFTDTESTENKFILGKVDIELVEPSFLTANATDIVPGTTVAKDPTIKNVGRNSAYVFLAVDFKCLDGDPLFTYTVNPGWTLLSGGACDDETGKLEAVYYYGSGDTLTVLDKASSTPALFNDVTLMRELSTEAAELFNNVNVNVKAYAIQSEGLTNTTPNGVFGNFPQDDDSGNGNG